MPTYRFKGPDGKVHLVEADNETAAIEGMKNFNPAQADANKRAASTPDAVRTLSQGISMGWSDEADALLAKATTALNPNRKYSPQQAYDAVMQAERGRSKEFEGAHPIASTGLLATGGISGALALPGGKALAGFVKSGVPAAASIPVLGGLLASKGLIGGSARAAAEGGLLGGLSGAGMAEQGQRTQGAQTGAKFGAALGAATPSVIAAGSNVAKTAGRIANHVTDGAAGRAVNQAAGREVVSPQQNAVTRVVEALKRDKATPEQIRTATNEWLRTGASSPAFVDILRKLPNGGEATMGLVHGAGLKSGPAKSAIKEYSEKVTGGLKSQVTNRTSQLVNDARTVPEIETDINNRIAASSTTPEVRAGSGGAAVSDALNARYDAANSRVNQAYGAAREARPDAAHVPANQIPNVAQGLREAVADFGPEDVPGVSRIVAGFDNLGTMTARDLFEARARLSNLRASQNRVEATAAGRAVSALDNQIDNLADNGAFTGDPGAIGLWRNAISERRQMGRQFEGNDAINDLTERAVYGDGRTRAIAPEDASNALLGRTGVSGRQDSYRDLARIRDTLGEDSSQWQQLAAEARNRVLGPQAGGENFGQAWQAFEQQSPELAGLLMPQQARAQLGAAQQEIAGAVADRGALNTGQSVLNAKPAQFAAGVDAAGDRLPLAQVGAVRSMEDAIGAPAENSTGLLNRLSTSPNETQNLNRLFGADETSRYQDSLKNDMSRVFNARHLDVDFGSGTAGRLMDGLDLTSIPTSPAGFAKVLIDKLRNASTITDAEREGVVNLGIGGAQDVGGQIDRELERLLHTRLRGSGLGAVGAGEVGGRGGSQ